MVHDFVDDDRPDARSAVWLPERGGNLLGKLFLSGADHVTSERSAVGGSPKSEAVGVAGEVCGGVTGEQIDVITGGVQGEAVIEARGCIESSFVKDEILKRRNACIVRDAILHGNGRIVREKPSADINRSGCGIEEFDRVASQH